MKIDTHHHLWEFQTDDYAWMLNEGLDPLRHNFLPPELKGVLDEAGVDGAVVVQVRQEDKENEWMLELAEAHAFMLGVVGWVPLTDEKAAAELLEKYADREKFLGVRHIVQEEPDDNYILREDFNRGITAMKKHELVYDILIFEKHLKQTIAFVDKHPDQFFVLDHIAKPRIKDDAREPWATLLHELAKRENLVCKLSGVSTEADHKNWTEQQLQPYMETALDAFGADRLMFGSDWPVSLLATNYKEWHDIVERFVNAQLSDDERTKFWHTNAVEAYGLMV